MTHIYYDSYILYDSYRGKSPITDPSRISVTIRDIKKLYLHELLVL